MTDGTVRRPDDARSRHALFFDPWLVGLAAVAVVAVAIPIAILAASGTALPGFPRFEHDGFTGDAGGYYAAAREFIAAVPRLGSAGAGLLALGLLATIGALILAVRRGRLAAHWTLAAGALAAGGAIAIVVTRMSAPGAAVFGWPLVWSIPLFPLRAAGLLDPDLAFDVGFALAVTALAVTVLCIAAIGRSVTGRRSVGLLAAALYALWPLLVRAIAGPSAWENGSWGVGTGLYAYSEPLSTALVTGAIALLLCTARTPLALTAAGLALSLATLTKVSNGLLAAVIVLVCLRCLGLRRTAPLVAGGLALVPVLIAYWPRGYPAITGPTAERPAFDFSFDGAERAWLDSLVFSPRTLLVLVPVAAVGVLFVRSRFAAGLLALPVLVNAAFYTVYEHTPGHPRFLYVGLPAVSVLWAAGAIGFVSLAARRLRLVRSSQSPAWEAGGRARHR
jgi:hypothetical protein